MRRLTFLMGLALVLLHGTTAGATTIGTTSQNGDVFTLSYVTGAADPIDGNNNAWLVTVSVNTIGHTLPASDYFDAIAEKLGAPDGGAAGFSVSAGGGSWAYMAGGTSNSGAGCNGQGNGFECYQYGNG